MPISSLKISDAGIVVDTLAISERSLPVTILHDDEMYVLAKDEDGKLRISPNACHPERIREACREGSHSSSAEILQRTLRVPVQDDK
jgi:hypothetical protein